MNKRLTLALVPLLVNSLVVVALCLWCRSVIAQGVAQNVNIGAQVIFGLQSSYSQVLFQTQSPTTLTAQFSGSTTVTIPANSTNNTINTANLFPGITTPICVGISDVTATGVPLGIGLSSSDPRINQTASGFTLFENSNLPTLYVDNNTSAAASVQVFAMGN